MKEIALFLGQGLFILLVSPLVNGVIKKTKARMQNRVGPPLWQPYLDIIKFLRREAVTSVNTSWLTSITPYICLSAYLVAGGIIPLAGKQILALGDIIAFIYLFALARFFLALASLESGGSFGGMGSSREIMIATLVEPVLALGLFGLVALAGTTDLAGIRGAGSNPAGILALIGLMVVIIAETGRVPVDNPDTHLELTMVHEGMLLEYSGRQLGWLHLAAVVKETVLLILLIHLFFPANPSWPLILILISLIVKIMVLGVVLALIESVNAKMRLFRLPELMAGGAAICLLSILINSLNGL